MDYQTFEPSAKLSAFVKCYWTLESLQETDPEKQKILPDGCMEMIFHYGDLYKQYLENNQTIIQPKSFVFGQITSPLEIEPTGRTGIFSVRFHPEGFIPFATIPLKQMENKAVSLEDLYGEEGKILESKIINTVEAQDKIAIIESFLEVRLMCTDTIDRIVKLTVETILEINGHLSVNQLSEQLQINRKQLERKFSSVIGLSPKQLSKIIRLQATLKLLNNKEHNNLTAVAYESDYYDQAHFIKDFKEFTGLTPKKFYGNNLKMNSIFYGRD